MRGRAGGLALVVAWLLVACSTAPPIVPRSGSSATPAPVDARANPAARLDPPAAPSAPVVTAAPTPAPLPHVFVIVMENTGLARALRSRPISSLASRFALATNYHAVARPSLPNYLAMTSGTTWGIADNGYHALPETGIGAQLSDSGVPWRAYMEGLTGAGCMRSPYPYALKHNPFAYYGGCDSHVAPLDAFESDLAGATPNFVWITPGLCHDGHDCAIDEAGAWLDALVAKIVGSHAWSERGMLFIAWDEGDGGDANLVPLIVATPRMTTRELTGAYDHYSLLATFEDLFALPRLNAAVKATSLLPELGSD